MTILITGANGEIGHGLIEALARRENVRVIAIDLNPMDPEIAERCAFSVAGDITDPDMLERIGAQYDVEVVYHLAALLSTRSERQPKLAHRVNVNGTLELLEAARSWGQMHGRSVKFLYPSSIAVYGIPTLEQKAAAGAVKEGEWAQPRTMYGINKLYCEALGFYYSRFYRQLDASPGEVLPDFRCIRFPGLISAATVPAGGTSDYAAEMLHAAAQGEPYACFVRPETRIPFMAMPDAVRSLLMLSDAPWENMTQGVYNVSAFHPSAREIEDLVRAAFPQADIHYEPDVRRNRIVDGWPESLDDSKARADWGWSPSFDLRSAFDDYLIPALKTRYAK